MTHTSRQVLTDATKKNVANVDVGGNLPTYDRNVEDILGQLLVMSKLIYNQLAVISGQGEMLFDTDTDDLQGVDS
jgi:hypothetical protein